MYFQGLDVDGVDVVDAHAEWDKQQQRPPIQGMLGRLLGMGGGARSVALLWVFCQLLS